MFAWFISFFIEIFNRKMRGSVIWIFALLPIMLSIRLSIPVLFKKIVGLLSNFEISSSFLLSLILIGYGLSWILNHVITQLQTFSIFRALEGCLRLVSVKIIDHLLSLSLRFHIDRKTGALINHLHKAQRGIENITWGLFSFLVPICIEMILSMVIIASLYGTKYGLPLLLMVTGYGIVSVIGARKIVDLQKDHNKKIALASGHVVDTLLNFETVKYFNNELYEHQMIDKTFIDQENAGVNRFKTDALVQMIQSLFIGLGLIYVTWTSGQDTYHQKMIIGDFVLINGYLLQMIMPLHHLGYVILQVRRGLQDISILYDTLRVKSEVQDIPNPFILTHNPIKVVFDHVCFGYIPERLILDNVSFDIPVGKTIGIVGPSGSGKSTIARLLYRFYDVEEGHITINGYDIRHVSQSSLHQVIGIVPQDPVLFNNSLYYNIAYGNPVATKEAVENASRAAELDELISSLPDGYNTMIGERGLKLSGGEKQRVAIARVLLKNPSLFIFDEATSSLDSQTESKILKNLAIISSGTSTLIIAHRLSTVIHADEIIVLDKGKIVERGSHQHLLIHGQIYAQLWYEQLRKNEPLVAMGRSSGS